MNIKIDEITDYCTSILSATDPSEIEFKLRVLLQFYKSPSIALTRGSTFWRARKLGDNKSFDNLSDLSYPPKHLVKEGRVNNKNEPVFYLSTRKETALSEIDAQDNDSIQIAGYRIVSNKEVKFSIVGMFWSVFKNGSIPLILKDPNKAVLSFINNLPTDIALRLIYIDKFFADILSDKCAYRNKYLHTRILSNILISKSISDAIAYPSIKDNGAYNLAVKPNIADSNFQNISCSILQIEKKLNYGIYLSKITNVAKGIDESGNFLWVDQKNMSESLNGFHSVFYNQNSEEDEDINSRYLERDIIISNDIQ